MFTKNNTIKNSKLLILVLTTLFGGLGPATLSGCSNSLQSADQVNKLMVVNLKSNFVDKNPFSMTSQYLLVVTNPDNSLISSQIIKCYKLNDCKVLLSDVDKAKTDSINIRLLAKEGGLLGASSLSLSNYSYGAEAYNPPVIFSEQSPGQYILNKLAQISNVLLPEYDGGVNSAAATMLGISSNLPKIELVLPISLYQLANQVGLADNEPYAIMKVWYNIYGSVLGAQGQANDSENSGQEPVSPRAVSKAPEVFSYNDQASTQALLAMIALAPRNNIISDISRDKIIEDAIKAAEKKLYLTSFGVQALATKEQVESVKIVRGVLEVAVKFINKFAPGIGTGFSILGNGTLDYFFPPETPNPNALVEQKLDKINGSLSQMIVQFDNRAAEQNNSELLKKLDAVSSEQNKFNRMYIDYLKLVNSGFDLLIEHDTNLEVKQLEKMEYGQLIDAYLKYAENHELALKDVTKIYENFSNSQDFTQLVDDLTSTARINNIVSQLTTVRNDQRKAALEAAHKINNLGGGLNVSDRLTTGLQAGR